MGKFDRTGLPSEDTYDLAEGALIYDDVGPDCRRVIERTLESECPTDKRTISIFITKFHNGKVLLWGEDYQGDRTWLRDDDEIARKTYEEYADLFDYTKYPRQEINHG